MRFRFGRYGFITDQRESMVRIRSETVLVLVLLAQGLHVQSAADIMVCMFAQRHHLTRIVRERPGLT